MRYLIAPLVGAFLILGVRPAYGYSPSPYDPNLPIWNSENQQLEPLFNQQGENYWAYHELPEVWMQPQNYDIPRPPTPAKPARKPVAKPPVALPQLAPTIAVPEVPTPPVELPKISPLPKLPSLPDIAGGAEKLWLMGQLETFGVGALGALALIIFGLVIFQFSRGFFAALKEHKAK